MWGLCGEEFWDSNDVCDVVPNGAAHRFGSRPKGDRLSLSLSRVLDEEADLLAKKHTHAMPAHSRRARTRGRRVSTERQANQFCMRKRGKNRSKSSMVMT